MKDQHNRLEILRHSTSHVMAQAVGQLFPQVKFAIGPAIDSGFYYDFDLDHPLSEQDLEKIEKQMLKNIKEDQPFERIEMKREEAISFFKERGEKYKVEILEELNDPIVSLYKHGDFIDLCRGPHIKSTGEIKAFKLLSVAGAYWRGDEKREQLQRIYGTAFETKEELEKYLRLLEEAKKRDHRVLGPQLGLFSIEEIVGPGLIFYHPKGAIVRRIIEDYWKKAHELNGYQLVYTPHIARAELWHASGHFNYYRENMFVLQVENQEYVLKPMNCPGHIQIYKSKLHSYKELPYRLCELGTVYRYERSGTLHGLLRVRGFTQDDAHIFCRPDQIKSEVLRVFDLALHMLKTFGFEQYWIELSARDPANPDKYAGTTREWDAAENALIEALYERGVPFERMEGEAVFYGPKIDVKLPNVLGKGWQGPTIQFDFNLPRRLDVTYVDRDSQKKNVMMVHHVVLAGIERFLGILIEHYAGAFPVWLSPVQVIVLTITDDQIEYASSISRILKQNNLRVEEDFRNEKISFKIREAQINKIPYMITIGKIEVSNRNISVRHRKEGNLGTMELDSFLNLILKESSPPPIPIV